MYKVRKSTVHTIYCYRPQQSCEGYVFTGVCLSTGGCLVLVGVCSWGVPGPGESAPRGVPGPRRSAPGRVPGPGGGLLPGGCLVPGGVGIPACTEVDPPGRGGYCCGRYATYWNAFLFRNIFILYTFTHFECAQKYCMHK